MTSSRISLARERAASEARASAAAAAGPALRIARIIESRRSARFVTLRFVSLVRQSRLFLRAIGSDPETPFLVSRVVSWRPSCSDDEVLRETADYVLQLNTEQVADELWDAMRATTVCDRKVV